MHGQAAYKDTAGNPRAFRLPELQGIHKHSCNCVVGYGNGLCGFNEKQGYKSGQCSNAKGNCDTDVDECSSKPCNNGARCYTKSSDGSSRVGWYACSCVHGFSGLTCSVDVDECASNPCSSQAQCSTTKNGAKPYYTCKCLAGYSGTNCKTDVNECASKPCKNGAACKDSSNIKNFPPHAFQCQCASGYTNGRCLVEQTTD